VKVVLINPELKTWSPNVWAPLGIGYIAAVLEQEGCEVEITDLNAEKVNDRSIQKKIANADIVGLTGMITEYHEALRLVDIVKRANKETRIILGGPLATTIPRELLQVSQADFIVIGEGERTIVELISSIRNGDSLANVKGIAYRDGDRVNITEPAAPIANIDTIPFPARHLLDMNRYLKNHFESFGFNVKEFGKIKSTNLITSRGCPYNCTFCFKDMWGYKWRGRSPENIVEEMELLYRRYGVNGFFFNDDTFVLDKKRVLEFCQLLKERSLDVVWYCNGRVNLMTDEMLKVMHNAGCRGIAYGIESGNQQILDSMRKNITLEQVRRVLKWTKDAGINACGYFMIGMLDETKATIEETIAFARELDLDFYGFSMTTPLPGTELYNTVMERGLMQQDKMHSLGEWGLHTNANLTQDCSDGDLAAFGNEVFREFTLKKRFGKYYIFNPNFLSAAVRTLLSLRNKGQARELAAKARGAVSSYRHKA